MSLNIPLAWLQLTQEKIRFIVAIAGVTFADILIFVQLGVQNSLYQSTTLIHKNLQADLILISRKSTSLIYLKTFYRRNLYQFLGYDGVESVNSLYVGSADWRNPQTYKHRSILILGFDPEEKVFNLATINKEQLEQLKFPDVVLFDRYSRPEFGPIAVEFDKNGILNNEVNERKIKIGGLFSLGASFAADGTLITSDLNFIRLFKERNLEDIDIGLIKLKSGTDKLTISNQIKAHLPKNIQLMTLKEFIEFEESYWASSTAIGFIFGLGTVMGFVVGAVIVYQILYTDISDHLAEYATFKAIGCTDTYLLIVVFQEALIIAVLGYIPGLTISWGLYTLTQQATLLPIGMTLSMAVLVLVLTILMCFISGAIAAGKLREADPADIFNVLY